MKIQYNNAFNAVADVNSLIRVFENYGNKIEKNGKGYLTNCEFHNDKNPSMAIYEYNGTGFYKCLGCGEKGNIVSYVKLKEGINSASKALEKIFQILNIDITPYLINENEGLTEEEIKAKELQLLKEAELQKKKMKHLAMLHRHYDKAFLVGNADKMREIKETIEEIKQTKDSKDLNKTEIINHALFKVDRTCVIDKYISEDYTGILDALREAHNGKRVLFISPTGTGKNYTTIRVIEDLLKYETILVGPNASNIEQTMNTYQVAGAYGDLSVDEAFNSDSLIKTMTWDKTIKLKDNEKVKDHILLLDEADQIFRDLYREKAIRGFNDVAPSFRGRMDMTGTPTKLDFSEFDYIVEYKQRKQTNYSVKMYDGIDEGKILEIIEKSNNFGMLYDNINTLEFLKSKTSKKVGVLTSDNKKTSDLYKAIMENSNMSDYEGCLNTSVMVAGVNIKNPDITDIIVVGVKDVGTIKQYVARYRNLEQVNVHIFNNYKPVDGIIYSIEEAIKYEIESIEQEVIRMNMELLTDTIGHKIDAFNLTPLQASGEKFYRDAELGVYKANTASIRGMMYSRYYQTRSAKQFRVLLQEQFSDIDENIEVVMATENVKDEIKKVFKTKKEEINEAFAMLEDHKENLIGYTEYAYKGRVSEELDRYWRKHKIEPFTYFAKNVEDLGLTQYFKHKKVRDCNEIFTKYVVEYGYSVEYAWKMSKESNNVRANAFRSMNLIAYRHFEEYLPSAINNNLQEVKLYDTITKHIGVCEYYTKEGVEALTETLKSKYKAFNLNTNDVAGLIKLIYNVKEKKVNANKLEKMDADLFLEGKKPEIDAEKKHAGKRVGMMNIESFKTVKSLKEELAVPENDYTVEIFVNNKIKQYVKSLSDAEKASLKINLDEVKLYIPPVAKAVDIKPLKIENNASNEQLKLY